MNARALGLHRPITRRDFLNGAALTLGGTLLPAGAAAAPPVDPPARTGLRGSHDGAFQVAHQLRDHPDDLALRGAQETDEVYDLIVVGGGISGLAAAHFFRQQAGRAARVPWPNRPQRPSIG